MESAQQKSWMARLLDQHDAGFNGARSGVQIVYIEKDFNGMKVYLPVYKVQNIEFDDSRKNKPGWLIVGPVD